MGEERIKADMNSSYEMDSGYPDSLNSSPHSRETDSDHRWEAGVSACGSRFRLMCSYGGKIQQRSHDNHLSYVGGDTRILAVDRNIKFASMDAKLSNLWGTSVSFKYQLPNEDLDALVSVTNDEDMENMIAEYDRLQKMGYRFSRLRLFAFANKPAGTSLQTNLGSPMEDQETKQESWFVDALNAGPVSGSETSPGHWMNNNNPNYLSGPEGNGAIEGDRTNSKRRDVYNMGRELQQQSTDHSSPVANSPIIGYSSVDSIPMAPARLINTSVAQAHGFDYRGPNQAEMGINLGINYSMPTDSSPVPEIGGLKTADRTASTNIQKQEQYTSEFLVEQAHQQPQLQVPIQEFQKLQLRQPQVDDSANQNITGRRMYSDPLRAVNLSSQDITRSNPVDHAYMPRQQLIQQNLSPSEYYMDDQGPHFVSQSYWQMEEPHGDQQYHHPVYFVHAGSPVTAVPSMGQPAPGGGGGYYNPVQRVTAPVTTVRAAAAVQRQTGSDPTEPYRAPMQIRAPVPKGPYTPVPSGPVASDPGLMYTATAPVPQTHTDPYFYQNVVYEPSSRQVYYTQPPPAMNPQYQSMNPDM